MRSEEKMKVGIFGAGQGGLALSRNLHKNMELMVWLDNDENKWGGSFAGIPIDQPERFVDYDLSMIYTGTLNRMAAISMENQLFQLGFGGSIFHAVDLRDQFELRLGIIRRYAECIERMKIPGEIAELGVYQGDLSRELETIFPHRHLYLFDTFSGFQAEDLITELEKDRAERWNFCNTSLELVMGKFKHPEQISIYQGRFPETIPAEELQYAFVSLDPDLYQPVKSGLEYFYPRLSKGGIIVIHDYDSFQFPGVRQAVDEFCQTNNCYVLPICDFHGTAVLMK